jgi:hypothetical protein
VCQLTPDEIDHIDIKEGKTMDERAMMNAGWLDSSKSLMEQVRCVCVYVCACLRVL